MNVVGYKIRRADGRYSTGGSTPEFTSAGKTWSNVAALHNHFAVIEEFGKRPEKIYHDCSLVLLTETDHVGIGDYVTAIKQRKVSRHRSQRPAGSHGPIQEDRP